MNFKPEIILAVILTLAIPIAILGTLLLVAAIIRFLLLYYLRIRGTKDPDKYPGINVPPQVTALLEQFHPKVRLRISDDEKAFAHAAVFNKLPAYIILSRRLFEPSVGQVTIFDADDVTAIVAHELGHIVPKSHAVWLIGIIVTLILAVILWGIVSQSLTPTVVIFILVYWLAFVSREEEKRADMFAVVDAQIGADKFARSLVKAYTFVSQRQRTNKKPLEFLIDTLVAMAFNSHPEIEQRVMRVRVLFGESESSTTK